MPVPTPNRFRLPGAFVLISCALAAFMFCFNVSCAAVKPIARTVNDAANIACILFGTEHPEEFQNLALEQLPAGTDEAGLPGIEELCQIKEVLQPFIDEQLAAQKRMATTQRQGMSRAAPAE